MIVGRREEKEVRFDCFSFFLQIGLGEKMRDDGRRRRRRGGEAAQLEDALLMNPQERISEWACSAQ